MSEDRAMSDRLPEFPVIVTHLEDPPGSGLAACCGVPFRGSTDTHTPRWLCTGCARAGLRAAPRAATEPPLDTKRLTDAMHVLDDEMQFMHRDAAQNRAGIAAAIAREYAILAALRPTSAPEPGSLPGHTHGAYEAVNGCRMCRDILNAGVTLTSEHLPSKENL